jgi:hypothetical protein
MATVPTTLDIPTGDFVTSTGNGAITSVSTSMTIGAGLNLAAANGILHLSYDSTNALGVSDGPETTTYTSYTTGTGAVTGMTRGVNGTTAVAHSNGFTVQAAMGVGYLNNIKDIITNSAWTTWTSTLVGWSGTPTQACNYIQIGKWVTVQIDINGTSNATNLTITLPIAAKKSIRLAHIPGIDNGANLTVLPLVVLSAASTTATIYKDGNLSAWTNVNNKAVFGSFTYEAN